MRADAFDKVDWLISQAAARGIYTVIDMHGAPGGVSQAQSSGDMSNTYWTNPAFQAQTSALWTTIANHYKGNPNVLGYDLLNEPANVDDSLQLAAYASLYNTVRAADPNHIVIIEGLDYAWGTDTLPAPSTEGWTNIIYEIHPYDYPPTDNIGSNIGFLNWEVISEINDKASWNVPIWAGEFNLYNTGTSTWQYVISLFNTNNIPWSYWTYKSCNGTGIDSWGLYNKNVIPPPVPNLQTDFAATIAADWAQWTTANAFSLNSMLAAININGYNSEAPYGGTVASIPGTVEAENYDLGGEGAGYHDFDAGNSGGQYRNEDVDIEACTDTDSGYNLGWTNAGEFLRYTVNVASAGDYTVGFRVASATTTSSIGGTVHLQDATGTNLTGPITIPITGAWQTWTTVYAKVTLPAGQQVLTLCIDAGGFNFNNMVFTSGAPTIPLAPLGLNATGGSSQISLSWNASTGANSYNIYRGSTSGSEGTTSIANVINGTAFTDTGLTNGTTYYYTVAAVNTVGTSSQSAEAHATPLLTAPTAPVGLVATPGNAQNSLTWTATATATSYNVYRSTTTGAEGSTPIASNISTTGYTDSGLTNGIKYFYQIAAVNSAGTSVLSAEVNATPFYSTSGPVSINCGGSAASPYVADVDYVGGSSSSTTTAIDTTLLTGTIPPQSVLQSNRYGNTVYTLPGLTPGNSYTVILYFAEEYWSGTGKRTFNVAINGTQVLSAFDIYAAAGAKFKAVQQAFTTTANASGQIIITFKTVVDNAQINGIAVAVNTFLQRLQQA